MRWLWWRQRLWRRWHCGSGVVVRTDCHGGGVVVPQLLGPPEGDANSTLRCRPRDGRGTGVVASSRSALVGSVRAARPSTRSGLQRHSEVRQCRRCLLLLQAQRIDSSAMDTHPIVMTAAAPADIGAVMLQASKGLR